MNDNICKCGKMYSTQCSQLVCVKCCTDENCKRHPNSNNIIVEIVI